MCCLKFRILHFTQRARDGVEDRLRIGVQGAGIARTQSATFGLAPADAIRADESAKQKPAILFVFRWELADELHELIQMPLDIPRPPGPFSTVPAPFPGA
jgi:hypothetical protein